MKAATPKHLNPTVDFRLIDFLISFFLSLGRCNKHLLCTQQFQHLAVDLAAVDLDVLGGRLLVVESSKTVRYLDERRKVSQRLLALVARERQPAYTPRLFPRSAKAESCGYRQAALRRNGLTVFMILLQMLPFATSISYWLCRFCQTSGVVPRQISPCPYLGNYLSFKRSVTNQRRYDNTFGYHSSTLFHVRRVSRARDR